MINKTILFLAEEGFTTRGLLRSDFLPLIKKEFENVVILVPSQKLDSRKREYEKDNVVVDKIEEIKYPRAKRKFLALLKFSIPTKEAKLSLMRNVFWPDGFKLSSWVIFFWPVLFSWHLSKYKFWRNFLRKIYSLFKINDKCLNILKKYKVDVVYANYTSVSAKDFNLELFRAAKHLNILTIGNISSWDQLYSKIFITQHTDFLTVPNELIKSEAVRIGDFEKDVIRIVGIPTFDFYSKKEWILPRKDFLRQIGADSGKKLIVFAGSIGKLGVDCEHFFNYFIRLAQRELKNVQFYLRPHPKYPFDKELINRYKRHPSLIFEERSEYNSGRNFELTEKDNQLLFNLLHYADMLICTYSTIMIEASFLDAPVINLGYFGNSNYNYYFRSERWFEKEHLKLIFQRNFSKIAKNDEEFLRHIKTYLENPALDREARRETAKEQMFLTNGKAAFTSVETISDIVKNWKVC